MVLIWAHMCEEQIAPWIMLNFEMVMMVKELACVELKQDYLAGQNVTKIVDLFLYLELVNSFC